MDKYKTLDIRSAGIYIDVNRIRIHSQLEMYWPFIMEIYINDKYYVFKYEEIRKFIFDGDKMSIYTDNDEIVIELPQSFEKREINEFFRSLIIKS
jgi:hypothetical protein